MSKIFVIIVCGMVLSIFSLMSYASNQEIFAPCEQLRRSSCEQFVECGWDSAKINGCYLKKQFKLREDVAKQLKQVAFNNMESCKTLSEMRCDQYAECEWSLTLDRCVPSPNSNLGRIVMAELPLSVTCRDLNESSCEEYPGCLFDKPCGIEYCSPDGVCTKNCASREFSCHP